MRCALASLAVFCLAWPFQTAATETSCTRAHAAPARVADILKNPERFEGRCVHLRGFLIYRGLVPDLLSVYAHAELRGRRLAAVYSDNNAGGDRLWSSRSAVDVVATATTCEAIWGRSQAAADAANTAHKADGSGIETIPFVSGLCHYQGGAALIVSDLKWLTAMPRRLAGAAAHARHGDLVSLPAGAPTLAAARHTAQAWFAQHRAEAVLATLPPGAPDIVYFRALGWDRRSADEMETYACVCKQGDCAGIWPISARDVDRDDGWPYHCLDIAPDGGVRDW